MDDHLENDGDTYEPTLGAKELDKMIHELWDQMLKRGPLPGALRPIIDETEEDFDF